MPITRKQIDIHFWRKYVIIEFSTGRKIYGRVNALRAGHGCAKMEIVDTHFVKQDGSMKPKNRSWRFSKSWIKIEDVKNIVLCEA